MKNILNLFGLGKIPFSATISSFIALILFFLLTKIGTIGIWINTLIFLVILLISIVYLGKDKTYSSKDPKEIIIDEFLGLYLCLIIANSNNFLINFALFIIFRIADIIKIPPFSSLNRIKRWHGSLIDDLAIGVAIGVAYYFIIYLLQYL